MDTTYPDADYEVLLQQYSKQVEALRLSEEEKSRASDTYKEIMKKKRSLLKALDEIKKRKSKWCATLTQELAKLTQYNQMDEGQLIKLRKMQQERSAMMKGETESMLLNEIHQLSTQYEHLQFEFENESLQAKVVRLKETIKPLIKEQHQYMDVLNTVKKESLKSESLQEYYYTTRLLPLSESINQETSEAFGFSNKSTDAVKELAKKMQNIEALKKQMINLET